MFPTLTVIDTPRGPVPLHTYGAMMLVAFSVAFLLVHHRSRRVGIHPDRLLPLYLAAFAGGLVGARLLYAVAVDWEQTWADPASLLAFSGFAYYGGVMGGALGVFVVARIQHIPFWKFADIASPALVLGLALGRIGCLCAGCCHGARAPTPAHPIALLPDGPLSGQLWLDRRLPWITAEFYEGGVTRAELLHTPLYPTQLWAVVGGLALAGLLVWMWRHRRFDGQITALMLVFQPIYRIVVESFRADHRGYAVSWEASPRLVELLPGLSRAGESLPITSAAVRVGLTTSQTIGLAMIALGLVLLVVRHRAGIAPEEELVADEFPED